VTVERFKKEQISQTQCAEKKSYESKTLFSPPTSSERFARLTEAHAVCFQGLSSCHRYLHSWRLHALRRFFRSARYYIDTYIKFISCSEKNSDHRFVSVQLHCKTISKHLLDSAVMSLAGCAPEQETVNC
jgi:hypothetical protein